MSFSLAEPAAQSHPGRESRVQSKLFGTRTATQL